MAKDSFESSKQRLEEMRNENTALMKEKEELQKKA